MILIDFAKICHSDIKVLSAYNGKVLCKRFDSQKHENIGAREVVSFWSEVRTTNSLSFGNIAIHVVCVYVHGAEEYRAERAKKDGAGE